MRELLSHCTQHLNQPGGSVYCPFCFLSFKKIITFKHHLKNRHPDLINKSFTQRNDPCLATPLFIDEHSYATSAQVEPSETLETRENENTQSQTDDKINEWIRKMIELQEVHGLPEIAVKKFSRSVLEYFEEIHENPKVFDIISSLKKITSSQYLMRKYVEDMNDYIEPERIPIGDDAYHYIPLVRSLPQILKKHSIEG